MSVPLGFLAAVSDPNLLGDPPLWPGQEPLYRWVDDGIRDGLEEFIVCCGRQVGKSELAIRLGIWQCVCRPDLDSLMARSYALVLATDREQARDILRRAVDRALASPVISQMVEGSTRDELRFKNGTAFLALPTDQGSLRGRSYRYVHLDEIGHLADRGSGAGAEVEEVVRAVTPGMVMFGGRALRVLTSTPYGADTWFGRRVQAASKGELVHASLYTATTEAVNPHVSRAFLAEAERDDPDGFRSEYLGELTGSGGQLIADDVLEAAIVSEGEFDPSDGSGWIGGLDVGFLKDCTAAVVVGRSHDDPGRLVVGAVRRWEPPTKRLKPVTASARRQLQDRVLAEVAAVFQRFGVWQVAFDGYEAPVVREALRGVDLQTLSFNGGNRLEAFSAVRGRLQAGTLGLIRDEVLLDELRRIRTSQRAGSMQVVLPRTRAGHFDTAVALAMAVWLADKRNPPGTALPLAGRLDDHGPLYGVGRDSRGRVETIGDFMRRVF